jgi:hypothetical protein
VRVLFVSFSLKASFAAATSARRGSFEVCLFPQSLSVTPNETQHVECG